MGGHPINLVRCNDPICAGGDESSQEINSTFCARGEAGVAIDADGNPIVSQWNGGCVSNDGWLNVASCVDPSCAAATGEPGTIFDVEGTGSYNSIAIGSDGNPVVSYYDAVHGDLKVLHCNDPICTGDDETITPVDSDPSTDVGWFTSIAVGADGKPVIAYYDATNGDLKVARCNDKACAGGNETRTPVDTSGDVGTHAAVAIGLDGKPVVAYYDATNADLKLARCNDAACAGQNEKITSPDSAGDVGQYASLSIGVDGVPVVAYLDATNSKVKVARPSIP
jgi:hypothetical protein